MFSIQANESGTRHIQISVQNLETIRKYSLFQFLLDSNGIVTEPVLEKLRLQLRDMLCAGADKDLVDLCIDVVFHRDMKAFGLSNLLSLYEGWNSSNPQAE